MPNVDSLLPVRLRSDDFVYNAEDVQKLIAEIESVSYRKGFEFYPFMIGWYNDCVQNPFALSYTYDTIAVLVVSAPSMFENYFLPFLAQKHNLQGQHDVEVIHDYDMHPNRRPKILVQTACHVSGAAFYYQRSDVKNDVWPKNRKMMGVCVHPKYGGWFAMRGIMVFRDVSCAGLPRVCPTDVVRSDENRVELLRRFNSQGEEFSFRDIVPSVERYSPAQRLYFQTKPADRKKLLQSSLFYDIIRPNS